MRTIVAAAFVGALLPVPCSSAADQTSVEGVWQQVDESGRVGGWFYFSNHDGIYDGRLVKMFPKPGEPAHERCVACKGAQKNAPMIGLVIVRGMRRDGLAYEGGTILDPRDGSVYQAEMKLSRDGQNLSVRGYLGIPLFGQTQVWKRLPSDALPPALLPREKLSPTAFR